MYCATVTCWAEWRFVLRHSHVFGGRFVLRHSHVFRGRFVLRRSDVFSGMACTASQSRARQNDVLYCGTVTCLAEWRVLRHSHVQGRVTFCNAPLSRSGRNVVLYLRYSDVLGGITFYIASQSRDQLRIRNHTHKSKKKTTTTTKHFS